MPAKNNSSFSWIITFSKQPSTAWVVDKDKWDGSDAIRHSKIVDKNRWILSFYLTCEVTQIISIKVYICCIHWNWMRCFVVKSKNKRTLLNPPTFCHFKWVRHCLLSAESSCNPFSPLCISVHKAVRDLFAVLMWACLLNWVLPHPKFPVFTF